MMSLSILVPFVLEMNTILHYALLQAYISSLSQFYPAEFRSKNDQDLGSPEYMLDFS